MASSTDPGLEDWIRCLQPDLIVVSGMSQLLQRNIFSLPKYGTINLHGAYLPEYRGPNPVFWQYYDQILEPGVTVHYIDDGEDTGDIIKQQRVRVNLGIKAPDWHNLLKGDFGVRLLLDAIREIETSTVQRKKQPMKSPTCRARNISKGEYNEIIKWEDWPIDRIWHIMRGTELWLDCIKQPSGLFWGQRWVVGAYQKLNKSVMPHGLAAGSVYKDLNGYFVHCQDGKIRLHRSFSIKALIRSIYRLF